MFKEIVRKSETTLQDVAEYTGVSRVTVSVVLNGAKSGTRVSAATRQRILDAAKELRYAPNAIAQGLKRRQMSTVGVAFGRVEPAIVTNFYASGVLSGVLEAASQVANNVCLYTRPWQGASQSASEYQDRRADGLVLVHPFTDNDMVPTLLECGVPLVTVAGDPKRSPANVDVDNTLGVEMALDHLRSLGHTRIAHIAGDSNYASSMARAEAFQLWMSRNGLPLLGEIPFTTYKGGAPAEVAVRAILKNRPTAIFCANDGIATAALTVAQEYGLRVPEDLSIIGFNDSSYAAQRGLSSVREPLQEMGAMATRMLLAMISGESFERNALIQPNLVVRSTTGEAPS